MAQAASEESAAPAVLKAPMLPELSLNEALSKALSGNPELQNLAVDSDIAKERISAARSRFGPQTRLTGAGLQFITPLQFNFKKGSLGRDATLGPIPDESVNVSAGQKPVFLLNASVVQPLLHFNKVGVSIKQENLAREITQHKLTVKRQQVANQVKHAYYRALELQGSLDVVDATRLLYVEINRTSQEHLKLKAIPIADALEAKQALVRIEYEELRIKNQLKSTKEQLSQLIGADVRLDYELVSTNVALDADLDTLARSQEKALQFRAELRQSAGELKNLSLIERARRLEKLPEVNLCLDYLSIFNAENFLPKNLVFAGLVANWEPIDWGRRRAEIAQAKKQSVQAANSLKGLQNQILAEVGDATRRVQESQVYVQVTQLELETAKEKLRVLSNRYKEKAVLLQEVLQGQRDMTRCTVEYKKAMVELWAARADLERAVGEGKQ